jgi:hypothetical protein
VDVTSSAIKMRMTSTLYIKIARLTATLYRKMTVAVSVGIQP